MESSNQEKLVQVFAGSLTDASFIQTLLENEGIEYVIENELMGTIAPWQITPGGVAPVKILVFENDAEKAIQVIESQQTN
jgi:hypothetical protein